MIEFSYQALPWNIVFGCGAVRQLPEELETLGLNRALVLTTPEQTSSGEDIAELLGPLTAGVYSDAKMHVPANTLEDATRVAAEFDADCTVAIGGGSTTGLGKALAVREDLPNIVIPTTYAGSEMTDIWAVTEKERKVTARDVRAVPTLTIYDPELTLSLPGPFAVTSGLNALAQAVVNVATDKPHPMVANIALDGIRALGRALPVIHDDPNDMEARSEALYGASMAGAALGTGKSGLHHRLCHTFGGTFGTPHAETHAILLPHSVAYNATAAAEGTQKVADALGLPVAATGIYEFAQRLGAPNSLQQIGIREEDLDKAATVTLETEIINPEPVTEKRLRALLENALTGKPPN